MSGSTVGGVLGAAVGFWIGGPEGARWGWMIGSAVGGAVDPDVIRAPSIGDAQRQTSQAGIPIPKIYGKPQPIKGNLIDGESIARRITVEEQQGKGGGPVVESERFLLTYAVGICEGPIAGIQRLRRNGEIVYDRTTDGEWSNHYTGVSFEDLALHATKTRALTLSNSGKVRIYLGDEAQLPDPALEAIHGVGNTPYYRGLAYMVVIDDDVTQTRGAASIWDIEPVAVGVEADIEETQAYVPARYSSFNNAHWPLAGPESDYIYVGNWINGPGAGFVTSPSCDTIQEVFDWVAQINSASPTGAAGANVFGRPGNYIGYMGNSSDNGGTHITATNTFDVVSGQPDVADLESVILLYQWIEPELVSPAGQKWWDVSPDATCSIIGGGSPWLGCRNGQVVRSVATYTSADYLSVANCGSGMRIEGIYPLCISASRRRLPPLIEGQAIPGAPGYYTMPDGSITKNPGYTEVSGTFKTLAVATIAGTDPTRSYTHYELGPVLPTTDPDYNNATYWTAAYDAAVTAGTIEAGLTYGPDYPVVVSSVYQSNSEPFTTLEATDITLQSVVEDLCERANLPSERLDATDLTDIIPGYLVAAGGTVADAIRPLQQPFVFDTPEIDGQIVCRKRGDSAVVTITDDDLLELTDDDVRTTPQPVEYPKKVHFIVPDPGANYTPTPQTAERYTPDVKAVGEMSVAAPIPFGADEAKQKAEIMLKVAWARAEGTIEIPLPELYSQYVPTDAFNYANRRWLIEDASYADGIVRWRAVYDRVTNYTSDAVGVPVTPPTIPGGGPGGPTQLELVNISPLNDTDDKVGLYVLVRGPITGWPGCTVYASLDQVDWITGPSITTASVIGETTTDLPAGLPYYFHPDATFDVQVEGGTLSSSTFEGVLSEANLAIVGDEVLQFQTATDNGDGAYTLTGLARGRLETPSYGQVSGTRFAMLSAATFFEIPAAWIGRIVYFRAVTTGTDAEDAEIEPLTWNPPRSQYEWAPTLFLGTRDTSNNVTINCVTRGRLGTTAVPVNSSNWDGLQIKISKSGVSKTYRTPALPYYYSATQQTADFGSATGTLEVTVQAVNRVSGAGGALIGTIA